MKSTRIYQYILLIISLLFVTTTCQREEEVAIAEVSVKNQQFEVQYTRAQLSCAFESNATFKKAVVYYSADITFEEYQSQDMTKQKDGSWLVELEDLINDTTYYVRYEVLNSYSNFTIEQIDTFATHPFEAPILSSTIVLDTTSNTASIAGKIISNGGLPITECGVCYSLSANPVLEDSMYVVCNQALDSFVCELKELNVVTTYHARAYAKNEKGVSYGDEVRFTTLSTTATVGAIAPTDIALTSATIAGEIISDGGATLTDCGICYSIVGTPTIDNDKVSTSANIGSFTCQLNGLQMGTTYYVRLYATNANGTVYSNPVEFTTLTTTAEIITTEATNITAYSAIVGGEIVNDGGEAVTERGVCYAGKTEPTTTDSKIASGEGVGIFSCMMEDLRPGTTYYARTYAINKQGIAYGNEISFTTLCVLPEVVTTMPTEVGMTNATVGGKVTTDGGAKVTERGVCYATLENPTIDNAKKEICGTGIGEFSVTLTGLQRGTTYYVCAYAINSEGVAYGDVKSFVTSSTHATVVTAIPTGVGLTEATVGGEVTDDGGTAVTEHGICYGNAPNPSVADTKVQKGTGVGAFTHKLTNLAMGATYHVRAYAINANGTAYGESISFTMGTTTPSVTTSAVTNITPTTATIEGNVLSDGGAAVIDRGVYYSSTNQYPTEDDIKVSQGAGIGVFTCELIDLALGTTYYVRAYATNSNGTQYGETKSFTTGSLPATLTTTAASNITINSATVGSNITSDGGAEITARGVCYSTKENPTIEDTKVSSGSGVGEFSCELTGLTFNTTYYVRAYATNSQGTAYGNQITFKTLTTTPTVVTNAASNVTATSATVGGNVTNDGGATITARGICYGTKANPTIDDNKVNSTGTIGIYTCTLSGLSVATKYYARAYATNANGTVYGEDVTFTTLASMGTLTTTTASNITINSATVGGNITSDGGAEITARGVCYSTKENPTIEDTKVSSGSGVGAFSCDLTGLTFNTTYYVRAYATNSQGTAYGNQITFKTLTTTPTVVTIQPTNISYTSATVGGNVTSDGGASVTERGVVFGTNETPTIENGTKTSNGSGMGEFTCNLTNLQDGITYYARAYAINANGTVYGDVASFKTKTRVYEGGHEYVDLGLSVMWASMNVGAENPEEYGDYFAWGETTTKTTYNWSTYKHCNGAANKLTKYNANSSYGVVDNKTQLDLSDDAARANWGGVWRMPTDAELSELKTNCVWKWTTLNGVDGYKVTSKTNGNSIFIPAAGSYSDSSLGKAGGNGYYWSSLLNADKSYSAWRVGFSSSSAINNYDNRYYGFSVRPVFGSRTATVPTVTTQAVDQVTTTTAVAGGNVTSEGNASVTERGVCYSTSANPTTADTKVTNGTGTGSFSCNLTNLQNGTTYYVRAYAINEKGTAYGEEVTFTTLASMGTLTTTAASNITVTSATVGGNITSDGGAEITARGVCFSTTENPTVEDTKVASGSGVGAFSCDLTGLTFNTTYYVRAYATNSKGTAYGNQISFKTLTTTPTVVTKEPADVDATFAMVSGNVTNDGGATITARGICYNTEGKPTIDDNKVSSTGTTGTYTCTLSGLIAATKYYARAYATNANGTVYGEEITFTTLASMGTLTTNDASNITVTSATVGGNITSDGGAEITARGVCFSTKENPTIEDTKVSGGSGVGAFSCELTGLTFNTTYYVRAYATNSKGTAYGNQISFKTLSTTPTVVTKEPADVDATFAMVSGNVTNDGGSTITARGICYNTEGKPTIDDNKVSSTGTTGTYTCTLSGLSAGTVYYARAYATNANGTVYGEDVTFTTTASKPNVVTLEATDVTGTTATLGGNVLSSGGADVLKRGLCYATTANPTTSNTNIACGSGVGEFSCSVMDLTPNTTYYVRAYATNTKGTAYAEQVSFTTQCTAPTLGATTVSNIGVSSATIGGSITSTGGSTITERGICYNTSGEPTIADDAIIVESTSNSFTGKITNLQENTTYYARAYAINDIGVAYGEEVSFTISTNGYEYVDLGLSVKWATMNVGASKPEDYGSYFAWGETTTKSIYNWSTYKYCNGTYVTLTKYNHSSTYGTVDNKTQLDLSDDAARANWGGVWRMPKNVEWDELIEQCTWTWTIQNGVKGYKVTSKSNGNSIFLPAAGYRDDSDLRSAGSCGHYWSRVCSWDYPYDAWYGYFNSSTFYCGYLDHKRTDGLSVRPVCP